MKQKEIRIVRETERLFMTSISRSQAWKLEQKGEFPKRVILGSRSVGWIYSELVEWVETRARGGIYEQKL